MYPTRTKSVSSRGPSIAVVENLESRWMMSATVPTIPNIHTVLSSTATAVTKTHSTKTPVTKAPVKKPKAPRHTKAKHSATTIATGSTTTAPTTPPSTTTSPVTEPDPPLSGHWNTVFDDEFNGTTLNPVWHSGQWWDQSTTIPAGDGELEAYDPSGVSVSGGELHLSARADSQYGAATPYVSGMVTTGGYRYATSPQSTFSFQYGYMEVRAKVPSGQGLWPAIWMLPASYADSDGEIDVMEELGSQPTKAYFTVHHLALNLNQQFTETGVDLSAGFHTYGVDWEHGYITWYLDGVPVGTCTTPSLIPHEPMYPIMNLAVGGEWPGAPSSTTPFPASMDVDYIRIWQSAAA
jgi:beta-glucanase (GH16 family)